MTVRVLVVDDSRFFRNRVSDIIAADPLLEVVGTAGNGQEAIAMVNKLAPDVITMDVEMPIMDGISAVREIMSKKPTPILMFSSTTTDGAKATLDALEAGAVDFLTKNFENITNNAEDVASMLRNRIYQISKKNLVRERVRTQPILSNSTKSLKTDSTSILQNRKSDSSDEYNVKSWLSTKGYGLVVIGASTGGPVAVQNILSKLPSNFPIPIVVVQHMPGTFTGIYAERLDKATSIKVKLASDNDALAQGVVLIAPGGKQLTLARQKTGDVVKVQDPAMSDTYKPCIDVFFSSVAKIYSGKTLAIVLTGMGSDGCKGSQLIKANGGTIWAQNEATSVVYGMPGAVAEAGICDSIIPLREIEERLVLGV